MSDDKKIVVEVSQAELDRIEKVLHETTVKFIEELPSMVRTRLEQSIAGMLGFEKDTWGGTWKVDHCNGRMSVISEMVGRKAREAVGTAMNDINFTVTPDIQKAVNAEFAEAFRNGIRERLREYVSNAVTDVLKAAATQSKIEIEVSGRVPTKKEIADPKYGKKPLEKLIMDSILAGHVKPAEENK